MKQLTKQALGQGQQHHGRQDQGHDQVLAVVKQPPPNLEVRTSRSNGSTFRIH